MSAGSPTYVTPGRRQRALKRLRRLKMAGSAHRYVRGSTLRFYDWLETIGPGGIPDGPPIWICGDCHVGNLGPVASAEGVIAIQVRDLDQTVIGNPAHDLLRLALSLASAARGSDLPGVATPLMMEGLMQGYSSAFAPEFDVASDLDAPKTIRASLRDSAAASWKSLAQERLEDPEPEIPLGKKFWPLAKEERKAVLEACMQPSIIELVRQLRSRDDDSKVTSLDAAFWVKGCSSLGLMRYAVVMEANGGKKRSYCLMDFKEAVKASAPAAKGAGMPANQGERVVAGARHLSPHLGERMAATQIGGKAFFVREVRPQDLKLDLDRLAAKEATEIASYLGAVVGQAHSRQLPESERRKWLAELQKANGRDLDAPTWLWRAVVDLLAEHEKAYLEHCRRYALGKD
jgi:uncharacterized protein (DUF2252 family)